MRETFEPVIRVARLLQAERAELAARGPHFCIYHRFWQLETICTPGEAIAEIALWYRTRRISLPLSLRLMLLFDYLARHTHMPQCAAQIAAGLNVDPFSREHGAYARAGSSMRRGTSRTAVKQQIMRLRAGLGQAFRQAGLGIDPCRVISSEGTTTNMVRYRLKASVSWEHLSS